MKKTIVFTLLLTIILTVSACGEKGFYDYFEEGRYTEAAEIMSETEDEALVEEYKQAFYDKVAEYNATIEERDEEFTDKEWQDLTLLTKAIMEYQIGTGNIFVED